jgi:uncharacterized protein (DUF1800 family)
MTSRLSSGSIVALAVLVALTSSGSDAQRPPAPRRAPTAEALAAHALNRLTFGPRPGEIDRVAQMGVERWIDQQLRPESIVDSAGAKALVGCEAWTDPVEVAAAQVGGFPATVTRSSDTLRALMIRIPLLIGGSLAVTRRDSVRPALLRQSTAMNNNQLLACRLTRLEASDRQLLEVMTDFWQNHFSIYGNSLPSRGLIIEWDRAIIRPHALGRFRDLLAEVAYSPQMLGYLDNAVSAADSAHFTLRERTLAREAGTAPVVGPRRGGGLNENYGRELLELHTLGVGGGYTQADVIEVARAFTGWTHSAAPVNGRRVVSPSSWPIVFQFDSTMHDADTKVVLGHTLPAGRGTEDGDQVLDILARHPSTARFIARKLAVRFVSDTPPQALIDRAAATFLRTDGDIREVVRTIVTSPEFFSPDVFGAKVKSPQELVLSTRRALAAPVDTAAEMIQFLIALDQRPYMRLSPEGWPETGTPWLSFGAMLARVEIATTIGRGEAASIPLETWPGWAELANETYENQVDGVIRRLLHNQVTPATRAAMLAARPTEGDQSTLAARQSALREVIAMALASPQFQRR